MKTLSIIALVIAAFAAFSLGGARAADDSKTVTVQLNAQNNSGESGTATITYVSDADFMVSVNLTGGGAAMSEPQPAHIHKGSCANLDPKPLYPLTNVVNGKSDTTVMAKLSDIASGGYAINVHKSAAEASVYVACGDIQAMDMSNMSGGAMAGGNMSSTMPASGNGDMLLLAGLLVAGALVLTGTGLVLRRNRA
jgi:hypothetical protein